MIIVSGICCIYYIMMLVYSFYYLIYCLTNPLPWKTCEGSGFVSNCRDGPINLINMSLNGTIPVCLFHKSIRIKIILIFFSYSKVSNVFNPSNSTYISPAESFWLCAFHICFKIENLYSYTHSHSNSLFESPVSLFLSF